MFLVETWEGRVFTICKNRWYSDFQARQWGLRASKRDTRIKRCGLPMLFYIISYEIRTSSPANILQVVSKSINPVIDWWGVWLQVGCKGNA